MSVTVATMGGLGNQMFQYAFGLAQAIRLGTDLKLDISRNGLNTFRPFNLAKAFHIPNEYAEPTIPTFLEHGLQYNPEVEETKDGETYIGYWQTEKYFKKVEPVIRRAFRLYISSADNPWHREALDFLGKIVAAGQFATFVGVRRGDYLKKLAYHGVMPEAYYSEAIEAVRQRIGGDPVLFVFSDEPDWVENNWQFPYETHVFKNNPTIPGVFGREDIDLAMMKMCPNAVIANSSFHWWGAWLGDAVRAATGGTVIAPATWFTDPYENSSDIVPDRWIKI